jgi:hypothetical protein
MHDLVIDDALLIEGTGALPRHGVWVNGTRVVDEKGPIRDCGRPGKLLREFDA